MSQLPARQRASISFKLANAAVVDVPIEEAAQLGLHLAVFGPDEEMQRSRLLAEKIATAVSLAARDATAILCLTDSQRTDLAAALQAMRDDRGGTLPQRLLELQARCEPYSESLGDEVR